MDDGLLHTDAGGVRIEMHSISDISRQVKWLKIKGFSMFSMAAQG